VLLAYVPRDGRLINQYAADHSQSVAGGIPILALDMYEHAYHLDFGATAKAYISAFMRNIGWEGVGARYEEAKTAPAPRRLVQEEFAGVPGVSIEDVKAMLASGQKVQFIDTRPRHYAARTQDLIEGAEWRDPEQMKEWIGKLSKTEPVVTFCVYGFHVGCMTAQALREAGFDAKYMEGGHVAWKASGGKTNSFNP
jgi:Fe-Mn family superoxide dismutase